MEMRVPRSERGSILLMVAASLPAMLGVLGLAMDVGHLYVAKAELQAYVDSAAVAACYELDGTSQGLTNAQSVAGTGPGSGSTLNHWDFATKRVTGAQASFSQTFGGVYEASPAAAAGYRFVQVTATGQVPLHFLLVLPGVSSPKAVTTMAIAGQAAENLIGDGAEPFSPDAHNVLDANFGFLAGHQYTLKWPPAGQRDKNFCAGDAGFTPGGGLSDRGYIDVGQGSGNSALHDAIVNNDYNLPQPLIAGSTVDMVQGNKNVPPALDQRFNQDSDTAAATYSAYHGNGRRIFIVPVNNGGDPAQVIGFAGFFLPPNACGKNNTPCCAEYIGPVLQNSAHKAAGVPGLYTVKLFQ